MSMEQERNLIECAHVYKSFRTPEGEHQVVNDFNLQAKENEFLVLFGPGQCGKTTLINLIAGLDSAISGAIEINGNKVKGPSPERGVVFQDISLFPWLTTMGNVEYGPKMAGASKKKRRERAQYYINLVGLQGFENSFPSQLSGGMKQRVGIARAYCIEPKVMLMDEPFGALDAQTRYLMQEELQRIWQAEKRTIIFVTNNIEEALYLADRIIVLSNCPATVKKEYGIDLPRPRKYVSPEFLALRKEITSFMNKYVISEAENER
jgi:ABC-type nitrate/sulfonate/bicarbonate transport system ATPase subunit